MGKGVLTDSFLEQLERQPALAKVGLPEVGSIDLLVPPFFIAPRNNEGEIVGWKLLNPLTAVRNLATRMGQTAVNISRHDTEKPYIEQGKKPMPTLSQFSPADREKIINYYKGVKEGKSQHWVTHNKERGRPVFLKKNAEFHGIKFDQRTTTIGKNPVKGEVVQSIVSDEDNRPISWIANPFKSGSKAHARYEGFKNSKTVVESRRNGATNIDFRYSRKRGVEGGSILGDLGKMLKEKLAKVKNVASAVVSGRKTLPPSVEKLLNEVGDAVIHSAEVGRTPVQSVITGIIKTVSSTPYEKLFHLFIVLHTDKGDIRLEKNEVVSMLKAGMPKGAESMPVKVPEGLTVRQLVDNTQKAMGANFLTYASKGNNCQDFQMAILNSNGMGSPDITKFVKQDTESIFKEPMFRKFANTVTDIAGRANVLVEGGDLNVIPEKIKSPDTNMIVRKSVGGMNFAPAVMSSKQPAMERVEHPALRSPAMSTVYHPQAHAQRHNVPPPEAMGIHHHHHHYHSAEGLFAGSGFTDDMLREGKHLVGMGMWDWADPHKNGVAKAFSPGGGAERFGKQVASTLIHKGIPLATQALASAGANALLPETMGVAGIVAGQAGKKGGEKLADYVGGETGYGLGGNLRRFKKGSPEAKAFMQSLRDKRMKGKGVAPHSRSPITNPSML